MSEILLPSFDMVRNAHVTIQQDTTSRGDPVAIATINDRVHTFSAASRISKALLMMSPDDLAMRLEGGNFFFLNDNLTDFRDRHDSGFIHSDESIQQLLEVIGVTFGKRNTFTGETITDNSVSLSSIWSNHEISVPMYKTGGDFRSQLRFAWNPFMKDVRSVFELVRVICTNGMVGLASFLNTKIPLVNRWEEHLDIASRQIQNKVSGKVVARLGEMNDERASVGECLLVVEHANNRLENMMINNEQRSTLKKISRIASPLLHLGEMYKSNVFSDKRLAAQMPAHLSVFDTYNMVTEMSSHTTETSNSTRFALDKMANALVFDRAELNTARLGSVPTRSSFSDPEAAFFGKMN